MSRPREKTEMLNRDVAARIKELFGTIPNAMARLALGPPDLTRDVFAAALQGDGCRPPTKQLIEARWVQWCERYGLDPVAACYTLEPQVTS